MKKQPMQKVRYKQNNQMSSHLLSDLGSSKSERKGTRTFGSWGAKRIVGALGTCTDGMVTVNFIAESSL